jgi:hypothetical protein
MLVAMIVTRRWRGAALLIAGLALAVAPIAARNAIVTHAFAITSSQGGLNFYIGNHAGATGQYVAVTGVQANMAGQARDTRTVAEAAAGHALTDAQVSSYFTGLAVSWIREHPGDAVRLFARKLALTINARHQWLDYSYPYYAHDTGSLLSALIVGPWVLVPLGFLGAALLLTGSAGSTSSAGSTGSLGSGFWIWCSFVPFYALSVSVFLVAERYRLPLFVPLCVLSGAALARLPQAFSKPFSVLRPPSSAVAAAAVAALAMVVSWWPFQIDDGRVDEHLRLARVLMNRHDTVGAEAALARAHELRPGDTATEFNLGMAQLGNGQVEEGLLHVRHAVDTGVAIPGARYALAGALLTTGDRDGATRLLRSFYPAAEDDAESCRRVAQLATAAGMPQVAARYTERARELNR